MSTSDARSYSIPRSAILSIGDEAVGTQVLATALEVGEVFGVGLDDVHQHEAGDQVADVFGQRFGQAQHVVRGQPDRQAHRRLVRVPSD